MMFAVITVFVVPVLYCSLEELKLRFTSQSKIDI
jgi:hypothetical protein